MKYTQDFRDIFSPYTYDSFKIILKALSQKYEQQFLLLFLQCRIFSNESLFANFIIYYFSVYDKTDVSSVT